MRVCSTKTILKVGGQAAVVVPDNVLFEGGAGETKIATGWSHQWERLTGEDFALAGSVGQSAAYT